MPAALVTNFITAIERGDLAHAITLLSDDCEYDNVPMGKVFGAVAVNDTLAPFLARYRTGETWIEMPVAGLFLVRHGKIALWRDYFDRDTLLRQLAPASE